MTSEERDSDHLEHDDLGEEEFFVLEGDSDSEDLSHDEADDTFVLEIGDEVDVADEEEDANFDISGKNDGFEETSESLFDESESEDELFGDLDPSREIEAATEDVVNGESFGGTSEEELFGDLSASEEDANSDDIDLVDDEDILRHDEADEYESQVDVEEETSSTFTIQHSPSTFHDEPPVTPPTYAQPEEPSLPPPGYRPPSPRSSSSLPAHGIADEFEVIEPQSTPEGATSSFEHDLLGDPQHSAFQQSSGNWNAIDSGEFDIVQHEDDLASGKYHSVSATPPVPQEDLQTGSWNAGVPQEHVEEVAEEYDPIYGKPMPTAAEVAGYEAATEDPYGNAPRLPGDGDYEHLEEMVQDVAEEQQPAVVGGAQSRGGLLRGMMYFGMAASILVLGMVAFVTMRPDLPLAQKIRATLGLTPKQVSSLEVAKVDRPKIRTNFDTKSVAKKDPSTKGPSTTVEPTKKDPVAKTPDAGAGDGGTETETGPSGAGTESVANANPERTRRNFEALRSATQWAGSAGVSMAKSWLAQQRDAARERIARRAERPEQKTPTTPVTPVSPETGKAGDPVARAGAKSDTSTDEPRNTSPTERGGMDTGPSGGARTGEPVAKTDTPTTPARTSGDTVQKRTASSKQPPSIQGGPNGWGEGIVRGAQAFAQLQNGHFFVGRVQKVVANELMMTWGKAEITFLPGDLQKLIPVGGEELEILASGPQGYVKLKNENKIWGEILQDLPDVVTIKRGEHRIIIPKVAVAQVAKEQEQARVRLGRNDEDWSEESIPQLEDDEKRLSDSQIEAELPSGAIRVRLDTPLKQRSDRLRERIRRAIPTRPNR